MRRFTTAALALTIAATGIVSGALAVAAQDGSDLKIGVVTDVGTIDDRNFNQYTWEGAVAGAEAVGAAEPQYAISAQIRRHRPQHPGLRRPGLRRHRDHRLRGRRGHASRPPWPTRTSGSSASTRHPASTKTAHRTTPSPARAIRPSSCRTSRASTGVSSSPATWPASWPPPSARPAHIAAVGGTAVIPAVVNYIEGYANGAKSINPDAVVTVTYVSGAPDAAAFNDPAGGQAIAQQLLAQDPDIDVMFQVAGKTGNGVLQAACDAGIYGIGVDVDQFMSTPGDGRVHDHQRREEADQDTSPMPSERIAAGTDQGGILRLGHRSDGRRACRPSMTSRSSSPPRPATPWPQRRLPSPMARCRPAKHRKAPASACQTLGRRSVAAKPTESCIERAGPRRVGPFEYQRQESKRNAST